MVWYLLKLIVLLPLIGLLAWGSLKLARNVQSRLGGAPAGPRSVRVVETQMLSPTLKLAVLEFHGRQILVSVSRQGLARLAEAPVGASPHA
jgi:flagellar protein FliO/FliZ